MDDICLLDPIQSALRARTWECARGQITEVGTGDYVCEVIEAENDGLLYGLVATKEEAIGLLAHGVVREAKRRGASRITISPMRVRFQGGRECFGVNVMFQ